jgi:hypothetical protein
MGRLFQSIYVPSGAVVSEQEYGSTRTGLTFPPLGCRTRYMRWSPSRSVRAAAVVSAAIAVTASPALGQTVPGDSVTGTASDCLQPLIDNMCFRPITVVLAAHSGPSGENPTGTAEWRALVGTNFIIDDRGPVSCLAVSGHTAVVGYSGAPNTRALIRVTDGGSAPGQDSFEVVFQVAQSGNVLPPPDCSVFPPPAAGDTTFDVSKVNRYGDLVVTDAQPFPTSKDQCKNGRWRNFGSAFKNEGACVSSVANGGKKPPQG